MVRLTRRHNDDRDVVVKVLAHGGEVYDGGDVDRGQVGRVTDARKLKDLRCVQSARGQDGVFADSHALHLGTLSAGELYQCQLTSLPGPPSWLTSTALTVGPSVPFVVWIRVTRLDGIRWKFRRVTAVW